MLLFSIIADIFKKMRFTWSANRLGPDMLATHWMLHYKSTMLWICKKKFKSFASSAEFRGGSYAFYTEKIVIGERVVIRPGSVLGGDEGAGIIIEDDVLIGMNTHIYADNHRFDDPNVAIAEQGFDSAEVKISKGSWLGANVTVLAGVTIGKNAVVAAGAVVTKDVPPRCIAGGVPAKVIREIP